MDWTQERLQFEESHVSRYATPEEFIFQYAGSLKEFLEESLGEGESHIEDLVANTKAFSEAFLAIITHF